MIIKHTYFLSFRIAIQICCQLIYTVLVELVNKIIFRLQNILLEFCTLPELWISQHPDDLFCRPFNLYCRRQVTRTYKDRII